MSALPSYFIIDNLEVTNNVPTISSESRGLIVHVRTILAQRWDIEVDCRVLPWNSKKAFAWQVGLKSGTVPNEFVLPVFGESQAADTTTLGAEVTGATAVELNNVTDVELGDYFTFAGHTKVYIVLDVNVNTVTFGPNLVSDVALSEAVTFNPEFSVRMSNIARFNSGSARQPQNFSFSFVEVL